MTPKPPSTNRISAGVSFPAKVGTVNASWPLGIVVTTDERLSVDVRPNFVKRLLRLFLKSETNGAAPFWSASWAQLEPVDVGRRSLVRRTEASRGCRVVLLRRRELRSLLDTFAGREIPIRRVRTTLGWYLR